MSTKPKNEETLTRIYVLKDPETNEIRYVGKTIKSLIVRLGEHINEAKRNSGKTHKINWINSILNKQTIPVIEQIDECKWVDSENLEIYYIQKYKAEGARLVNTTDGGEGCLGRIISDETCKKISMSQRSRCPEVYQYTLDGTFVKKWNNATEAAETLQIKTNGITRCLRGDRFKYKNYIWKTEFTDSAAKDLELNTEKRHLRNISNRSGYNQSLLAKIISQESKLSETPYYYVYNSLEFNKDSLLYEGISANDIGSFINEDLQRTNIDLNSTITRIINTDKAYYDKYYISNFAPENYIPSKHKALLILTYGENVFWGIKDAAEQLGVCRKNIINNIKGITKTLTTPQFGKIKLNVSLNKEHGRLYVKTYGLSADEIEESVKETSS